MVYILVDKEKLQDVIRCATLKARQRCEKNLYKNLIKENEKRKFIDDDTFNVTGKLNFSEFYQIYRKVFHIIDCNETGYNRMNGYKTSNEYVRFVS